MADSDEEEANDDDEERLQPAESHGYVYPVSISLKVTLPHAVVISKGFDNFGLLLPTQRATWRSVLDVVAVAVISPVFLGTSSQAKTRRLLFSQRH